MREKLHLWFKSINWLEVRETIWVASKNVMRLLFKLLSLASMLALFILGILLHIIVNDKSNKRYRSKNGTRTKI